MESSKKLVVITGGAGRVATAMRPILRSTYRLRLADVQPPPVALVPASAWDLTTRPGLDSGSARLRFDYHVAARFSLNG